MPRLNFSNDLFLGLQELIRFWLITKGQAKAIWSIELKEPGLMRRANDNLIGSCFAVSAGTTLGKIKIAASSYAVTYNMDLILQEPQDDILAVPSDSNWYWVKVAYAESSKENGTVNIDVSGNMTGTGTQFLDTLRGGANFPSKIKFLNASLNTSEYEVVSIASNTVAVLSGAFSVENGLKYAVVGTFTPGVIPSESEKYPFRYDSCAMTLVQEVSVNTPPSKVYGYEFYIARVSFNGTTLTIQDKRTDWFITRLG